MSSPGGLAIKAGIAQSDCLINLRLGAGHARDLRGEKYSYPAVMQIADMARSYQSKIMTRLRLIKKTSAKTAFIDSYQCMPLLSAYF